jgi:hypothetical protein
MEAVKLQASFATSGISVELQKDAQNNFYLVMSGGALTEPMPIQCSLMELQKLSRILNISASFIQSSI